MNYDTHLFLSLYGYIKEINISLEINQSTPYLRQTHYVSICCGTISDIPLSHNFISSTNPSPLGIFIHFTEVIFCSFMFLTLLLRRTYTVAHFTCSHWCMVVLGYIIQIYYLLVISHYIWLKYIRGVIY